MHKKLRWDISRDFLQIISKSGDMTGSRNEKTGRINGKKG